MEKRGKPIIKRKKKLRKDRVALALFVVFLVPGIFIYRGISRSIHSRMNPKAVGTVRVDKFRDLNDRQLVAAKKNGVAPFASNQLFLEQKDDLVSDDRLEEVGNRGYYIIDRLTHSHPYLVPEAVDLLDDISDRFGEKLDEYGKGRYYFMISSLLRTGENQKSLSRSNGNASGNSSHLYGTTFDIPYSYVVKKPFPWIERKVAEANVIRLLSESIGELREEGRCLVVTEKKERCFHITVVE